MKRDESEAVKLVKQVNIVGKRAIERLKWLDYIKSENKTARLCIDDVGFLLF